jgi:hypothetical protein
VLANKCVDLFALLPAKGLLDSRKFVAPEKPFPLEGGREIRDAPSMGRSGQEEQDMYIPEREGGDERT